MIHNIDSDVIRLSSMFPQRGLSLERESNLSPSIGVINEDSPDKSPISKKSTFNDEENLMFPKLEEITPRKRRKGSTNYKSDKLVIEEEKLNIPKQKLSMGFGTAVDKYNKSMRNADITVSKLTSTIGKENNGEDFYINNKVKENLSVEAIFDFQNKTYY
jgi:hypothetical protein